MCLCPRPLFSIVPPASVIDALKLFLDDGPVGIELKN